MATIKQLYQSLDQRRRPEDVAEMIVELMRNHLKIHELATLSKAANRSLKNSIYGYTSMLETFGTAIGAEKQIKKAIEIFKINEKENTGYHSVSGIETFLNEVSPLIHKDFGQNNFKSDRLNKDLRKLAGLDISKRNYNKKWRLLKRIEIRLQKFIHESKKIELQKIAKHGLSHTISFDHFSKDLNTACFIAYFNARSNLRSTFTNQSQERPFDEICEMLFNRCLETSDNTHWEAISYIYSDAKVLEHLNDEQKGKLLGKWTKILEEISDFLEELWNENDIYRKTMAVKKGNDSTTWNNTAGAWNKARDNWMNLIYALGLESILEDICFGKVMRLMAADVIAWHLSSGGKIDPNTEVWNVVPLPWEVFQERAFCNKEMIIKACQEAGIDPEKSGWMAPRIHGVSEFKPTPELVHGVTVSNPFLAKVLRQNKYFSGKL
ncbi:hypothetical protein [Chryseobacterium sp. BIGb0232]|uniref:hypothetical protein n=1 Tax=Chryseobacterium sp. BIGb0232 TaxID=2940598 RepID=UPI000F4981F1|nr:hypothetical protein [Chryseobacterium sp. BIGb0232]MCS4301710.1 hypothetical protein [Chryseobacterium sp. BIGb0232]ROS19436.1 hypothetical protein EDF65_0124 [Chryseobacterium nakagawai]